MSRVLLIRGGAIGDFILTLPILEEIHEREPSADVEILGYQAIAELAVGRRHASAARRVDGAEWAGLFAPSGELAEKEMEYLRGFDRVFCVWPDADRVIAETLRRAGVRDLIAVNPMPPDGQSVHAIEHVARQCSRAGFPLRYLEPHLYPSERDRWWVERYMRVTGAGVQPLLGMHPGSGSRRKNWPARHFADVARGWLARPGCVLVVAGPADDRALEDFMSAAPTEEEGVFVMRNEALPRVAAALERCDAFVGNDSGITHMAAAVRTPAVAIFGATDPALWKPLAPRVTVLKPPGGGKDLAMLTPELVFSRIEVLLGEA